jgi:hypothetical protein
VQCQARHGNIGTKFDIYSESPVKELGENKKLVEGHLLEIIKESNYQVLDNGE